MSAAKRFAANGIAIINAGLKAAARRNCPQCGDGTLQREEHGWSCDGLMDPDNPNKPLEACDYWVEKLPPCSTAGEGPG